MTLRILAALTTSAYLVWLVVASPGPAKASVFLAGVALLYLWLWLLGREGRGSTAGPAWRDTIDVQILCIVAPLAVMAAYWNFLLMVQWNFDLLPRQELVRFDRLTQEQVRLYYEETQFFPFAFPANVLFSWRDGLPMEKYDLLGVVRPEREFFATFDEGVDRFLLNGWSPCAPGMNDCRSFQGVGQIAVPLDPEGASEVEVAFRAWLLVPGESARLVVRVNGERVGRLQLSSTPTRFQLAVPPDKFRRAFNRLRFRIDEWSQHPADAPDAVAGQTEPGDGRQLERVAMGFLRVTRDG